MTGAPAVRRELPPPTDDPDRAQDDLGVHGICALTGVLDDDQLRCVSMSCNEVPSNPFVQKRRLHRR